MESATDNAAEHIRQHIRARAVARARRPQSQVAPGLRIFAVATAIALHGIGALWLYLSMLSKADVDRDRIEVRLLDAARPEPALPEPPPMSPKISQAVPEARARPSAPQTRAEPLSAPVARAPNENVVLDTSTLFTPDGAVRLAPAPGPTPHEAALERANELMSREHNVLRCAQAGFDPRATAEDQGAHMKRQAKLWGFMYQRPWDIQAQYESQIQISADAANDLTIAAHKLARQACDDVFYRRPPRRKP